MAGATPEAQKSATEQPLNLQMLQEALRETNRAMELKLVSKFTDLINPITTQLEEIQASLTKTAQTAELALDLGATLQEENQMQQKELQELKEKCLTLDTAQRRGNLKFRDVKEGTEGSTDLICFMGSWLASVLQLEENVAPIITNAYRKGLPNVPNRKFPRDIIITLADARVRQSILNKAKEKGYLLLNEEKILVFQDIPQEALLMRKALKPTTKKLQEAKQKYKWITPGRLMVLYKKKQLFAWDEDSGKALLVALGLDEPMEVDKKSNKRRWQQPDSPQKHSKIPVRLPF